MQSSLINSIPALCVKSTHLLGGAEGVEAAMPNIRIIPLHWWTDQRMEVCSYLASSAQKDGTNVNSILGRDLCQIEVRAAASW